MNQNTLWTLLAITARAMCGNLNDVTRVYARAFGMDMEVSPGSVMTIGAYSV